MNVAASTKPASDGQTTAADVEGALRGIVRREVASYRRQPESGEASVNETHSVIRRVSVTSVKEIDTLIAQLQQLRDFLQSEGERIEREITDLISGMSPQHRQIYEDYFRRIREAELQRNKQ